MRLKTKLLVDHVVGSVLVHIVLAMHSRAHRRKPAPIEPERFVVLKLLGLGSIIQASPLITALKDRYTNARFVFVTKTGNDELTRRIPVIDSTMTIDDSSMLALFASLWRTMRTLRTAENTCFINLEAYSKLGILMTVLSGARWTAGFFRNPADLKLDRVFDYLVYFNPGAPISQVYLQLGRAMGAAQLSPSLAKLTTSSTDQDEVVALLGAPKSAIILVNPNASQLRLERRWPASRFAQLISELVQVAPSYEVLLIGAASERQYTQTVYEGILPQQRTQVRNIAGALSLGGLIALMGQTKLMITNDSGPMHIAFSLGTPTVAMFGPVDPDHYSFAGADVPHAVLYHRIYCSPCVHHFDTAPCRGDNVCMKMISHTEVFNAVLGVLRAEPVAKERKSSIVYTDFGKALGVFGRGD
jgi:ADP-heptose:LPS heptosyltransferase